MTKSKFNSVLHTAVLAQSHTSFYNIYIDKEKIFYTNLLFCSLTSRPCEKCLCTKHDVSYDTIKTNNVYMLQLAGKTKCHRVFKPANEKYKRHGLIVIYLQQVIVV